MTVQTSFNPEAWIEQELSKVTRDNLTDRYLAYARDYRLIGGSHRRQLLASIRQKFPEVFSGGSR